MRINYLCLKNYAGIYTGMRKREIAIDLSKSKNRVVLLIGDNGSGKTTILRELQPFANSGNIDASNMQELILKDENGYKEIHIENDNDLYVIKHHHLISRGSRTTKSFISKNGVELNPNGLVGSFAEIVKMELGIEQEYLKLVRLGSNVTGFMDLKASERKDFASKLLSEIDIYSQFYKKVNEDTRLLKSVMKSVVDKINKLKIEDEEEVQKNVKRLEELLTKCHEQRDMYNNEIGKITGEMNALVNGDVKKFLEDLESLKEKYTVICADITDKRSRLKKFNILLVEDIDRTINYIKDNITSSNAEISSNTSMINFLFTQLNNLYTQKEEKENNLKYLTSELELSKLEDMYLELHRKKEKLDKIYKKFEPKCTKDDLLAALRLMQEIDKIIETIYSFNHDGVVEVIDHIENNRNIDSYVKKEVVKIDDKMSSNKLEIMKITNNSIPKDKVYVMFRPQECEDETCPYVRFYKDNVKTEDEKASNKYDKENKKLEKRREYLLSLTDIKKNIDYIKLLVNSNKELTKKLPEDFFNISHIFNSIKECVPFFDETKVTSYIAIYEEYEEYNKLKDNIKEVKKEIDFIRKNAGSLAVMQKEFETIDKEIYRIQKEINDLKEKNSKLEIKVQKLTDTHEELLSYKTLKEEIESDLQEAQSLHEDINNKTIIAEKIHVSLINKSKLEEEIQKVDNTIKGYEEEINHHKFLLREFQALNKEKAQIQEKYDEVEIIREALSSNKGMPLLFIQMYLKDTRMAVNNLLDVIYKGNLEVEDFDINDKEFRIPYTKNGITVSDIIHTSQGERSFVSIALSFSLISKSIDKYNILLLDEIDSTLSQKNRYYFLSILEKQLDTIGAEQVFLITHNNMFDNYPVDLIVTSDVEIDNYKNMNIIFKA